MVIQTKEVNESSSLPERFHRRRLINILNHANFMGDHVVVNLRNIESGSGLALKATPEPCYPDSVRLVWSESPPTDIDTGYDLIDFCIGIGARLLIIPGRLSEVDRSGVNVLLPEYGHAISRRRMERHNSVFARVTLSRGNLKVTGQLLDFGSGFLKVRLAPHDFVLFESPRSTRPIKLSLTRIDAAVYTGDCRIKRRFARKDEVDLVLELLPSAEEKPETDEGMVLNPALVVTFYHPLSDKVVRIALIKASYNSLVVREHPEHTTLFQGLVIADINIDFGTGDYAQFSAKVTGGEPGAWILSILDMSIHDQRKLFSFLEKERGMMSGVSPRIDPDDLLEFFFQVGFIYPEKYAGMASSRDRLKKMLSRLYIDAPTISQHFVLDKEGVIEAHISMVRFYEKSWIIHHHAALGNGGGSAVLRQVSKYVNGYSALPSTQMDYLMCYYRQTNRFPNRVFGGFARFLNNPSLCSVDSFAYLYQEFRERKENRQDEEDWQLDPTNRRDLIELETLYQSISGGLMLEAFAISAENYGNVKDDLDSEFAKAGLRRKKLLFSLRKKGKLKVVLMAVDSDSGLNMSNLMKCIHLFVVDSEGLQFNLLTSLLNRLSSLYEERRIPILLFPRSYVDDQEIVPEKVYDLLVVRSSECKQFAEFTERLTHRAARKRRGPLISNREGETYER